MKAVKLLLVIAFASFAIGGYAQSEKSAKELAKERKEMRKLSRNELNEKASKAARKEAKRLEKEGWRAAPGELPIEKQLDRSYLMQQEFDDNMFPKYIMSEAMSIGENYDAAKMQALELAKQNLAGQIQTEVTVLINHSVENKQLQPEEASSVVQSISAGQNLISQSIGRVLPVVVACRTVSTRNKEVLVRIAYSAEMAKAAAKQAIREDLEKKGEELHNKLDQLLGW